MSRFQEDVNVSRIPKAIKTALNKLRPKSKDCASLNGIDALSHTCGHMNEAWCLIISSSSRPDTTTDHHVFCLIGLCVKFS